MILSDWSRYDYLSDVTFENSSKSDSFLLRINVHPEGKYSQTGSSTHRWRIHLLLSASVRYSSVRVCIQPGQKPFVLAEHPIYGMLRILSEPMCSHTMTKDFKLKLLMYTSGWLLTGSMPDSMIFFRGACDIFLKLRQWTCRACTELLHTSHQVNLNPTWNWKKKF